MKVRITMCSIIRPFSERLLKAEVIGQGDKSATIRITSLKDFLVEPKDCIALSFSVSEVKR